MKIVDRPLGLSGAVGSLSERELGENLGVMLVAFLSLTRSLRAEKQAVLVCSTTPSKERGAEAGCAWQALPQGGLPTPGAAQRPQPVRQRSGFPRSLVWGTRPSEFFRRILSQTVSYPTCRFSPSQAGIPERPKEVPGSQPLWFHMWREAGFAAGGAGCWVTMFWEDWRCSGQEAVFLFIFVSGVPAWRGRG